MLNSRGEKSEYSRKSSSVLQLCFCLVSILIAAEEEMARFGLEEYHRPGPAKASHAGNFMDQ
jgi:hypothetical protein